MSEETLRANDINLADYPPYKSSQQLEGQIKSADFGLNAADLTLENTRQEVKFQMSQAYYQVLQCNLRVVQIQYDVGNVAMADVIKTKVQIADSRQEFNTVRGDYENAVATLNNIIGLPTDTPLAAVDNLEWDIFDNNLTSTRVEQSKSEKRKAESLARQNLETIRLEVHNACTNLKIAEENIKITAESVEEAREKFLISQVRYEEGEDTDAEILSDEPF